jgi:hypothetical protein
LVTAINDLTLKGSFFSTLRRTLIDLEPLNLVNWVRRWMKATYLCERIGVFCKPAAIRFLMASCLILWFMSEIFYFEEKLVESPSLFFSIISKAKRCRRIEVSVLIIWGGLFVLQLLVAVVRMFWKFTILRIRSF